VVVRGPEIGRHFPLRRNRVVLGRSESADVALRSKEISRAHAAIEALHLGNETLYRLTDLESTNHTFVNGSQIEAHPLSDGDKIHLGAEVVLKFELHDAIDSQFHDEVRHRIQHDELTGLLTYESFRAALAWELERYATSANGCAVVMMDLDDFKQLNDTHGHLAGSAVLQQIGDLIRHNLRHFDVASRYGGEEFVAYFPETERSEAVVAAERLRRLVARHTFTYRSGVAKVTISMGVSHFPEDGTQLEALVQAADDRLYEAKRRGKNQVCAGEGEPAGRT
jgi:two-component system, cell cycle response regulator